MERTGKPVDEFIEELGSDVRTDIATLDRAISSVMAGRERVLWEGRFWGGSDQHIIGYGDYRYQGSRGNTAEWFVVGLASQKNYITVFVNAVADGAYLAETYEDRLGKVKVGRSSVSFKRLADVQLPALLDLVAEARDLAPADGEM